MKVVILAGGRGSRISDSNPAIIKPLLPIGDKPLIWHVMKHYTLYGFNQFFIVAGYKGELLNEYFNRCKYSWDVQVVDTGVDVQTGGRIKRMKPYIQGERFMLTWCDGLSNINLRQLISFHESHGKLATVTAVHPPPRFGHMTIDDHRVTEYEEKPPGKEGWINGAFYVLESGIFDYIDGDDTIWEQSPMENLVAAKQLMAYKHTGFWKCVDDAKDYNQIISIFQSNHVPWLEESCSEDNN